MSVVFISLRLSEGGDEQGAYDRFVHMDDPTGAVMRKKVEDGG